MDGGFAGEVPGVEFGECGVDVVGIERDDRRDSVVRVDLGEGEDVGVERLGSLIVGRVATSEDEALATGRDHHRRHVRDADVGGRPHIREFGVPTVSGPGVHDSPAILDVYVIGQHLGHRVPVTVRERRPGSARTLGLPCFPAAAPHA